MADALWQPFRLGSVPLAHRVVMAPLTRSRATAGGCPTELHETYYGQRASGGLIVSEATQISAEGQGYLRTPGIHTEEQVSAWRRVTDRVHAGGSPIFLQLWHVGRIAHPENRSISDPPVGPSAIAAAGTIYTGAGMLPYPEPHALEIDEIARIIGDYRLAAENARRAGFDGVEIHAANGYLIDQFLHGSSNRRDDRYGGTAANRVRFLGEVVEAVCDGIGADRVGVRLSPFGTFNDVDDVDPTTLFDVAIRALGRRGLAYLHVINPEVTGDRSASEGVGHIARFARERFDGPLVAAGGYDRASAEQAVAESDCDLVAFGRAFIANPDLPARLRRGEPLNEPDRGTFYTTGARGYTDYPTLAESPSP